MLAAVGFLRSGTFIKFIPFPVTVGFTAGIAVIIFASQVKELLGLSLDHELGELLAKVPALWDARGSVRTPAAVALVGGNRRGHSRASRWRPHWPGMLIAVGAAAVAASLLKSCRWRPLAPVSAASPRLPREFALPALSPERIVAVLPPPFPSPCSAPSNASVRRGRRRDDGAAPPVELRTAAQGAANVGASFRRLLRDRHHRAHATNGVRLARTGRSRGCCTRRSSCFSCSSPRRWRPISRWPHWRGFWRWSPEHDRKARHCHPPCGPAGGRRRCWPRPSF